MVAYIRRLAVERRRWVDEATFARGVALCQAIPGATAMQAVAYVGLRTRGVAGAAAAYLGFGLPACIFMTILSALYLRGASLAPVAAAFRGLQVAVVALIAYAAATMARAYFRDGRDVLLAAAAAAAFLLRIHPVLVIVPAAALAFVLYPRALGPALTADTSAPAGHWKAVAAIAAAAVATVIAFSFIRRPLFDLAILMARVDVLAFGGGFASLPVLYHEVVRRGWMDGASFMSGIALGQVTPGPIVITATFVGYFVDRLPGAAVATVFIFLPSFLLVIMLAPYFERLRRVPGFDNILRGVNSSFVGLLASAAVSFGAAVPWDHGRLLLGAAIYAALWLRVPILLVVAAAAAAGVGVF